MEPETQTQTQSSDKQIFNMFQSQPNPLIKSVSNELDQFM